MSFQVPAPTPGPWQMTSKPNDACCWTHHVETVERDPDLETVAKHNVADVHGEPNARLIAAAPDMRDALEAVRVLLATQDCNWATALVRDKVSAALTKAGGNTESNSLSTAEGGASGPGPGATPGPGLPRPKPWTPHGT